MVHRRILRVLLVAAALLVAPMAIIYAGALVSPNCLSVAASDARYDVVLVLGSGMEYDGRLHPSSQERTAAAVALYKGGRRATGAHYRWRLDG